MRTIKLSLGESNLENDVFHIDDIFIHSKTFDEHLRLTDVTDDGSHVGQTGNPTYINKSSLSASQPRMRPRAQLVNSKGPTKDPTSSTDRLTPTFMI
jgi:hypothetical protein